METDGYAAAQNIKIIMFAEMPKIPEEFKEIMERGDGSRWKRRTYEEYLQ